jgi:AcrR family transcriptional regulator
MNRDLETHTRLLTAAERLFAERGFRKVTVRDICRAARANVAAVNYHFGDKLGLYREVLRSAIDRMRANNDAARRAAQGRSPEERLRRWIETFVTRLLSSDFDTVYRLVHREVNDPTPALDDLVEQGIRPRIEYLAGLVADVLGVSVSDARVTRCVATIQTQVIAYLPHPIAARVGLALHPKGAADVAAAAGHIADFSLGGVRAVARAAEHADRSKRSLSLRTSRR